MLRGSAGVSERRRAVDARKRKFSQENCKRRFLMSRMIVTDFPLTVKDFLTRTILSEQRHYLTFRFGILVTISATVEIIA